MANAHSILRTWQLSPLRATRIAPGKVHFQVASRHPSSPNLPGRYYPNFDPSCHVLEERRQNKNSGPDGRHDSSLLSRNILCSSFYLYQYHLHQTLFYSLPRTYPPKQRPLLSLLVKSCVISSHARPYYHILTLPFPPCPKKIGITSIFGHSDYES